MPAEKQLPAVRVASGVASFRTHQETEGPGVRGLFSWKLVRIKSLAFGPLCPTELHKHDWSRSETSPRGKKSRAGWEHLETLERNQDTCLVKTQICQKFQYKRNENVCFITINPQKVKPNFPLLPINTTSLHGQNSMSLLHHSAARAQVFQEASLNGALLCGDFTCLPTQTTLIHTFLGHC